MYALTLHQPWASAIFHLPPRFNKRVENRSWKPPKTLIGQQIAFHAGKQWDEQGWDFIRGLAASYDYTDLDENLFRQTGIIGITTLTGVLDEHETRILGDYPPESKRNPSWAEEHVFDWFSGPYGWLLSDAQTLPPIPCKGKQKLWKIPESTLSDLKCAALNLDRHNL